MQSPSTPTVKKRSHTSSFLCIFILLWALPGCLKKYSCSRTAALEKIDIPLFIQMPTNKLVFENISPLIYEICCNHFEKIGYNLISKSNNGYTLQTTINSLDPAYKLVSPDVILFHSSIRLELACTLRDFNNAIVAQKTFYFSSLISKPRNPIINSDFLDFEYKRLLERSIPKVEQFFRPLLIKAFA